MRFDQARQGMASKPWDNVNAEVIAWADEKRAERVKVATAAIVEYLIGVGETGESADAVAQLIGDPLLTVYRNGALDIQATEDFRQKAKVQFEKTIVNDFPNWQITDAQKKVVIDRCLRMLTLSQICVVHPEISVYTDALWFEVERGASEFHCPICMEPLVTRQVDGNIDTSNMWFAPHRKTEHWSNNPCGHACCRSCMSAWAEIAIKEQKTRIKCPSERCSYSLWDQDLKDLVSEESLKRYQDYKNADYLKHLKTSIKKDKELKSWLQSHARPCPECHVIVSRSEGCDVMVCVCGTKFCYQC
jgi:hypothetical protein